MKKFFSHKTIACSVTILFALVQASCEKVVTIDVKSADSRVVVQGNVSSAPGPYTVQLNSSVKYYDTNTFPAVSGANVAIAGSDGQTETLSEASAGIYITHSLLGAPGKSYTLTINTNGKNYSAIDHMPDPLPLDSFVLVPTISRNSQTVDGYRVTCKFTDPVGVGNYYRVNISSNDTAAIPSERRSRILSDKLSDGQQLSVTFRTSLLLNDTVFISLQSISKSTYDFYNTLSNAEGDVGAGQFLSSLPANPTNNISNQGLGYFATYSETRQNKVVR